MMKIISLSVPNEKISALIKTITAHMIIISALKKIISALMKIISAPEALDNSY
jgi:hypothetical protein